MSTDTNTGKVTGKLVFSPKVELAITGAVLPATDDLPDGIELTAEGLGSISTLRGYFIYGGMVLVTGIIVAVRNDLMKQPIGTKGAFVLFPGIA